jgi:hypothetical protein
MEKCKRLKWIFLWLLILFILFGGCKGPESEGNNDSSTTTDSTSDTDSTSQKWGEIKWGVFKWTP